MRTIERRYVPSTFEVRANASGGRTIVGHAAVWNTKSQNLGGFREQIAPGAFASVIDGDIRGLFNHDVNLILGRTAAGTLRLAEDNLGLAYEIDVPDTTVGRDLVVSMDRGDVTQSSFSFRCLDDEWMLDDEGFPLRTVVSIAALADVGPVTFPAYVDADSMCRSALRSLVTAAHPIDEVLELAKAGELRSLITIPDDLTAPAPAGLNVDVARRRLELNARRHPGAA